MSTDQSVKLDERTVAVVSMPVTHGLQLYHLRTPHRYHVPECGFSRGGLGLVGLARRKWSHRHGLSGPAQGMGTEYMVSFRGGVHHLRLCVYGHRSRRIHLCHPSHSYHDQSHVNLGSWASSAVAPERVQLTRGDRHEAVGVCRNDDPELRGRRGFAHLGDRGPPGCTRRWWKKNGRSIVSSFPG